MPLGSGDVKANLADLFKDLRLTLQSSGIHSSFFIHSPYCELDVIVGIPL